MKKNTCDNESLKLRNFPKALATNQETLFSYIRLMFVGSKQQILNFNQYIFSHLRNTVDHQLNTMTLKNASKFIMTLLLLGNFHVYEKFVDYLLPCFMNKLSVKKDKKTQVAPVWHLNQFCLQTLYVLAQWLPQDFYYPNKPSIFLRIVTKYQIQVKDFMFYTIDKIVFCYRIIKDLGINFQQKCVQCQNSGKSSICRSSNRYDKKSNFQERQLLLCKGKQNKNKDKIWNTGFQLSLSQSMSQKSDSVSQNEQQKNKKQLDIHSLYSKQQTDYEQNLKKKIYQLEENIHLLQDNMYSAEQQHLMSQYLRQMQNKTNQIHNLHPQTHSPKKLSPKIIQFNTPNTKASKSFIQELSPNEASYKNQVEQIKILEKCNNLKSIEKSFNYSNKKRIALSQHIIKFKTYLSKLSQKNQIQFKLSLLHPKRSIHLKKINQFTLKCKVSNKDKLIKLKFYIEETKQKLSSVSKTSNLYLVSQIKNKNGKNSVELIDPVQNVESFDQIKTEYILKTKTLTNVKAISMKIDSMIMIMPIGLIIMLKPLKQFFYQNQNIKFLLVYQISINLNKKIVLDFQHLIKIFDQISDSNQNIENKQQEQKQPKKAIFLFNVHGKVIKLEFIEILETHQIQIYGSLSSQNEQGQYRMFLVNLLNQIAIACSANYSHQMP